MSQFGESNSGKRMVGFDNFVRHNPRSDKFDIIKFDHVEFWCSDAVNTSRRFTWGFGMREVARSNLTTGNRHYACSVVQSNDVVFAFTAPYCNSAEEKEGSVHPHPSFDQDFAHDFVRRHGLAVRAVAVRVSDAKEAYEQCVANGGQGVTPPYSVVDAASGKTMVMSEVKTVDDVVFRWMSGDFEGPFLANMEIADTPDINYGLTRIDHIVTNVPNLFAAVDHVMGYTGMHEFAEFTAEDVGTVDSGLNSMVLANNTESVLTPFNEPTFGTKRKSQIQNFLDHNNGSGVQHMALKTDDIFATMAELKQRSHCGGFEFMPAPGQDYYDRVPERIGKDTLTAAELKKLQDLGLLADKDDQGVLLQVFTKPVGDRPTAFLEIIQRIGCDMDDDGKKIEQAPGCGGFGKGNFGELFKSIEEFEKTMDK